MAKTLLAAAQSDIDNRWHRYEQMVNVERVAVYSDLDADLDAEEEGGSEAVETPS